MAQRPYFYGSGAIGGVVNIVDERVPTTSTPRAEWMSEWQSVNSEKLIAGSAANGNDLFAVYVDGFYRDSIDYKAAHGHSDHDDHEESMATASVSPIRLRPVKAVL
ncbi:hypothetical protein ALON55S_08504 [Alishewanella longhuensis]